MGLDSLSPLRAIRTFEAAAKFGSLPTKLRRSERMRGIMLFPVPIQVAGGPDLPPEEEIATFFWLDDQGEIAKTIESVPIKNGVAVYNGDPLPHGARWAITVHDMGGLPIFRSGPLSQLPGPVSEIRLVSQIRVFRVSSGAFFGIDSPDGAPELVRQRLNSLPEPLRVDSVKFSADEAGHEIVEVLGQLNIPELFSESFTHSLSLLLRPATSPGHPEEIIIVEPVEGGSGSSANLGDFAAALDQAIVEGVTSALNAAVTQIAKGQLALFGAGIPATLVSATQIEAILTGSDPQISVMVHGGAIIGGLTVVGSEP
jgi:hypothetical protein